MNNDYLDVILSTCFSLRKIKMIRIEEKNKVFDLRPQMHVLLCSPFGTFKSSITKVFKTSFPGRIVPVDDFTKPSLEGTITRDGDYIPPLLIHLGGKVLIIDEWNSVDPFARDALLSVLENQSVSRSIGFKVQKPFKFKNKYGHVDIIENTINGEMMFSCIAYAMEYPSSGQKEKALLSRFSPLFIEPTIEYMKANTSGEFEINVVDSGSDVVSVTIPKDLYFRFHEEYYEYIKSHDLIPVDSDDYGFISRTMTDIIRIAVYFHLKNHPSTEHDIIMDDYACFEESMVYTGTMLKHFINPKTKGMFYLYVQLLKNEPDKPNTYYAKTLGVTKQAITYFNKKLGRKENEAAESLDL